MAAWRSTSRFRRIAQREDADAEESSNVKHYGLYPVASLEDRRIAAVIDFVCLLFAYGGFMALFSSLGGQFSATKLNAVVYAATFAVVYLQYFALFTIFGGTTPGMMFRGLQVASFSGAPPTPRQYLLRSIGYVAVGSGSVRRIRVVAGGMKTISRGTIAFRART